MKNLINLLFFVFISFSNAQQTDSTQALKILNLKSGDILTYQVEKEDFSKLTSEMKNALDQLGDYMIDNPKIRIRINGHTDATGVESTRLEISSLRADEVKNYLIKNKSIKSNRIFTRGRGSLELLKTYPPEDKRQNRIVIEINPKE